MRAVLPALQARWSGKQVSPSAKGRGSMTVATCVPSGECHVGSGQRFLEQQACILNSVYVCILYVVCNIYVWDSLLHDGAYAIAGLKKKQIRYILVVIG